MRTILIEMLIMFASAAVALPFVALSVLWLFG